jgi:hypothetical protein
MNANNKQLQGMCGYRMDARESFLNVLKLLLHISRKSQTAIFPALQDFHFWCGWYFS